MVKCNLSSVFCNYRVNVSRKLVLVLSLFSPTVFFKTIGLLLRGSRLFVLKIIFPSFTDSYCSFIFNDNAPLTPFRKKARLFNGTETTIFVKYPIFRKSTVIYSHCISIVTITLN